MKPGDIVRMNAACKKALFKTGSHDHVKEFGRCVGTVEGLTDYGTQKGPEFDVRWQPSKLRYAYAQEDLQVMTLKAFYVEGYDLEQGVQLVYAYTPAQARSIGAGPLDCDYVDVTAHRKPEFDDRAKALGLEEDAEWLRDHGWRYEDEWDCGSCGNYAFGLEQYGVCRTCSECKQCGCAPDCDQSEGFSCG